MRLSLSYGIDQEAFIQDESFSLSYLKAFRSIKKVIHERLFQAAEKFRGIFRIADFKASGCITGLFYSVSISCLLYIPAIFNILN